MKKQHNFNGIKVFFYSNSMERAFFEIGDKIVCDFTAREIYDLTREQIAERLAIGTLKTFGIPAIVVGLSFQTLSNLDNIFEWLKEWFDYPSLKHCEDCGITYSYQVCPHCATETSQP